LVINFNMKNILFVSHDANRAGAQILLLRFLRLLKENKNFTFSILIKEGGIIENEFIEIAPTYFWKRPKSMGKRSFFSKLYKKITNKDTHKIKVLETLQKQNFDLIVSNTIANGDILPSLKLLNVPIKTYVHELEMGIQQYTKPEYFENVKTLSSSFIACAESVKENLIKNHQVNTTLIQVLPSLLPESALNYHVDKLANEKLRTLYKIPLNAFVIGGMGTVDLRKGVDIFLQVAHKLKSNSDIFFLWVGGQEHESEYKNFQIDKNRLELDKIIFLPSLENPLDYMALFDIFFVSSREDPYPLVVLEAAMLSKPILCFDKAGGAKDFVQDDCGAVLEYLSVDSVVKKIEELQANKEIIVQMGNAGRQKVLERHNQKIAFQTFLDILNDN
jgi:glycosyltransferase involved in cell wall biosynthesis